MKQLLHPAINRPIFFYNGFYYSRKQHSVYSVISARADYIRNFYMLSRTVLLSDKSRAAHGIIPWPTFRVALEYTGRCASALNLPFTKCYNWILVLGVIATLQAACSTILQDWTVKIILPNLSITATSLYYELSYLISETTPIFFIVIIIYCFDYLFKEFIFYYAKIK